MGKTAVDASRGARSNDRAPVTGLALPWLRSARPLAQAIVTKQVYFHGLQVNIPFARNVRLSIVAGNIRVQRLIDATISPGDRVVDVGRHAIRLHQRIAHSQLRLVPGAGHMVHHAVPGQVAEMIEAVANSSL